ncbi:hypothetical protein Sjap_021478 [Stephania japonica]|uniref:Auxin response factor n=1 Tax=Stephania japonica TaxID=461633 RepID=A0AAP0EMI9_9MAGN
MSNHEIDPSIWKACAGHLVQIPTVGSRVYYFPQGHAEHCVEPYRLRNLGLVKPYVPARIDSVKLLADSKTDEVFAKISLQPIESIYETEHKNVGNGGGIGEEAKKRVVSFAKVLTASDANNGGGFSVPRFCAESIFPGLNFEEDPPVQTIAVRDVHGAVWQFRHIYRGTPRRHLLTTGWSKFVNGKKLVAGDSAVFMRNGEGELFVGIKRAERKFGGGGCNSSTSTCWECDQFGGKLEECDKEEGFSRGSSRRISGQSLLEAAENATAGRGFEVLFYPNAGLPEFVVRAEVVESSLSVSWQARMRFKMAMESEDASRVSWFHGAVSSATVPDHGPFRGSPWRMLQVTWDEPAVLQNVKRVSPGKLSWLKHHRRITLQRDSEFLTTMSYYLMGRVSHCFLLNLQIQ